MDTNGYRDVFWKLMPILTAILVALAGTVWGLTYAGLSSRINRMDDIILSQSESIARIEAKMDVLIRGCDLRDIEITTADKKGEHK